MGGYGATRIGMKHADVFGSLYIMSPCCLSPRGAPRPGTGEREALAAVKTPADSAKLPFGCARNSPAAAAWSPNPRTLRSTSTCLKGGERSRRCLAKWTANAPLKFIDQYIGNLRQYRAIAIDVGDQDGLRVDAGKLHDVLDRYGITNSFEVYSGTHTSEWRFGFQDYVMPFFSQHAVGRAGEALTGRVEALRFVHPRCIGAQPQRSPTTVRPALASPRSRHSSQSTPTSAAAPPFGSRAGRGP